MFVQKSTSKCDIKDVGLKIEGDVKLWTWVAKCGNKMELYAEQMLIGIGDITFLIIYYNLKHLDKL